jgi:hypothetical protein
VFAECARVSQRSNSYNREIITCTAMKNRHDPSLMAVPETRVLIRAQRMRKSMKKLFVWRTFWVFSALLP